jgi:hypothetical protein
MDPQWNLYVVGDGSLDTAETMLTNFVAGLHDRGLTIDEVKVLDGTYYTDPTSLGGSGETGWTMFAYGTGDITRAYEAFPTFVTQLSGAGITVTAHGVTQGAMRDLPITA